MIGLWFTKLRMSATHCGEAYTLMPFCVAQLRGFLVQHRVEGFFDGLSNDSFQVVLEIFPVNFDYIVIHRMHFF